MKRRTNNNNLLLCPAFWLEDTACSMGNPILSQRAGQVVTDLNAPWRFAPRGTYHPVTAPEGLVSFATAENNLVAQHLEIFTNKLTFPAGVFEYRFSTGGGPSLPSALASHLNQHLKPFRSLSAADIQITASATAAHDLIGWAAGDPGDGVLLSKPVYGRLELDFGNKAALKVVYADTTSENVFHEDVVHQYEEALQKAASANVNIRLMFITNPHNPLGRCYPRETLVALMKFCNHYRIHFVSDEVYACSLHTSNPSALPGFTSALAIDSTRLIDPELLHVTYGMSKDFAAPGLRLGAILTRSNAMHRAASSGMRFLNPSGLSVAVATAMLTDVEWHSRFLDASRNSITEAYKHVTTQLKALGIRYVESNAGFFILIDLSPFAGTCTEGQDVNIVLAQRLLDHGVFLHPGEEHGPAGWFRMVYTQDARVVDEGVRRIQAALSIQQTVGAQEQAIALA